MTINKLRALLSKKTDPKAHTISVFAYMAFCPIYSLGNISTAKSPTDTG